MLCSFLFTVFFSLPLVFSAFPFPVLLRFTVPGRPLSHNPGTSPISAQPQPGFFQLRSWTRSDLLAACKALIAEDQTLDESTDDGLISQDKGDVTVDIQASSDGVSPSSRVHKSAQEWPALLSYSCLLFSFHGGRRG